MSLEYLNNLIRIVTDFNHLINSPAVQGPLLPIKIVFIFFTLFFLFFVIYFYFNSSYIMDHFLQDTMEFFSWQPYGAIQINKRWQKIAKRLESGNPEDYKLSILEADDFLYKVLEDNGYEGETFEEIVDDARVKITPSVKEVMAAHRIRNSVVHDTDYILTLEIARQVLTTYERAIKNL